MQDENGEWVQRQVRAFVRWSVFWLVALAVSAVLVNVGELLLPGNDVVALMDPYVGPYVINAVFVTAFGCVVLLAVRRAG